MRRTFFALAISVVLAAFAGCTCDYCNQGSGCHVQPAGCRTPCAGGGCRAGGGQAGGQQQGGGTVTWPYYTIRGPRDFLETHPQSIGP
jgi:hypothetical protein